MTWSVREKTNCIIVEWCCLDNRQRQMWTATQLWQKIFSNRSPAFCACQCPAIACDFPLILRNWSVLFSCLTVTLVLQCHFYRSLLCSNHLLSPLPLPFFSLSLSLSVTDTTLSSERGKNPSLTLPWFRAFCAWTVPAAADWLFVLMWEEPFSDVSLSGGALSHKHHLHHQEAFFFLYITLPCHGECWNEEENIKWKQLWKQHPRTHVTNQNLNLAYFPCMHFASTYLVNLPPIDSNSIQ